MDTVTFGLHKLMCRDIKDSFTDVGKVDLVYVDPPWENLKYWGTLRGYPQSLNTKQFIARLLELCMTHRTGPVIIEYGVKWAYDLIRQAECVGLTHQATARVYYAKTRLSDIHLFDDKPAPDNWIANVGGTSGIDAVRAAMAPFVHTGAVIFDMCCGTGLNAKVAIEYGCAFIGNDFNPIRLAKTEKLLRANL